MNDLFAEKEKAKEKIFDALVEYAAACHVENIANESNRRMISMNKFRFHQSWIGELKS